MKMLTSGSGQDREEDEWAAVHGPLQGHTPNDLRPRPGPQHFPTAPWAGPSLPHTGLGGHWSHPSGPHRPSAMVFLLLVQAGCKLSAFQPRAGEDIGDRVPLGWEGEETAPASCLLPTVTGIPSAHTTCTDTGKRRPLLGATSPEQTPPPGRTRSPDTALLTPWHQAPGARQVPKGGCHPRDGATKALPRSAKVRKQEKMSEQARPEVLVPPAGLDAGTPSVSAEQATLQTSGRTPPSAEQLRAAGQNLLIPKVP